MEEVVIFIFYILAESCGIWELCSPTRDRTCACCIGNAESSPLNLQGSPRGDTFRLEKDLSAHCVDDGPEWVVVKLQGSRPAGRLVRCGEHGGSGGRR